MQTAESRRLSRLSRRAWRRFGTDGRPANKRRALRCEARAREAAGPRQPAAGVPGIRLEGFFLPLDPGEIEAAARIARDDDGLYPAIRDAMLGLELNPAGGKAPATHAAGVTP